MVFPLFIRFRSCAVTTLENKAVPRVHPTVEIAHAIEVAPLHALGPPAKSSNTSDRRADWTIRRRKSFARMNRRHENCRFVIAKTSAPDVLTERTKDRPIWDSQSL